MEDHAKKSFFNFKLNNAVFWPPFVFLLLVVALSFINQEAFAAGTTAVVMWLIQSLGWSIGLTTTILVLVCLVLVIHPAGKTKLGGPKARPHFKSWSWFGMVLCSSIAIGVVFWGVAEPMTHFAATSEKWGLEPFSPAAAVKAMAQTNLEWAIGQYAYYALFAVAVGLACFNYGQPMMISSFMFFAKGKPLPACARHTVDILCVIAIVSGVACSLGTGTMQVSSGLNQILGVPINKLTWLGVIIAIVVAFVGTSYSGISKGIKWLGEQNLNLFLIVLAIIFILGPSKYILNLSVESTAYLFQNFLVDLNYTGYLDGQDWPTFWPMWLFVSVAAFAPMVGMFMATISYGRSVREVVVCCCLLPGLFNLVWFNVFGGTAFRMQTSGEFDIWGKIQALGLESAMFEFFASFPFGSVLVYVFLVVIFISFVTLANAVTTSVSIITTDTSTDILGKGEPSGLVKITWGALMGATAYIFIGFAGIEGAKMAALIGGFPILLLTLFVSYCICKVLFGKPYAEEKFASDPVK